MLLYITLLGYKEKQQSVYCSCVPDQHTADMASLHFAYSTMTHTFSMQVSIIRGVGINSLPGYCYINKVPCC